MILFWIGSLCVSACALVGLVAIKQWEMTSGRMVGASLRPRLAHVAHTISLWVERILPTLVRMYTKIAWRKALAYTHKLTALGVVQVEKLLERTLHTVRHTTDVRRGMGEASAFLREVSEHKRKLLRSQTAPQLKKE